MSLLTQRLAPRIVEEDGSFGPACWGSPGV